ncbi:MAG: hypothetical protein AAFN10_28375 [Bacteroidota bacterium]
MSEAAEIERLIAQYLDGQLDESEREAFESRLETDGDFAAQFQTAANLEWAIRANALKSRKEQLSQIELTPPANAKLRPLVILSSVAAVIAILLLFWWFNQSPSLDQLYAQNLPQREAPSVRSSNPTDSLLSLAHLAYNQGQFAEASERYTALIADSNFVERQSLTVFLGLSYLHQGKSEAAITQFELVDALSERENVDWYLVLAYLQRADVAGTQQALQKILTDSAHYYYDKAVEIQADLENIN